MVDKKAKKIAMKRAIEHTFKTMNSFDDTKLNPDIERKLVEKGEKDVLL
jgi:hypothetical protein